MGRSHQARCAVIEQITAWLTQHTYLRGTGDAQQAHVWGKAEGAGCIDLLNHDWRSLKPTLRHQGPAVFASLTN